MCCGPDHIGPPPGWYAGTAEVESLAEVQARVRAAPMALQLAALASVLQPHGQADPGPRPRTGPRPVSTEGGNGRALITRHGPRGEPDRFQDWAGLIEGGGDLYLPGGTSSASWVAHPPWNP